MTFQKVNKMTERLSHIFPPLVISRHFVIFRQWYSAITRHLLVISQKSIKIMSRKLRQSANLTQTVLYCPCCLYKNPFLLGLTIKYGVLHDKGLPTSLFCILYSYVFHFFLNHFKFSHNSFRFL